MSTTPQAPSLEGLTPTSYAMLGLLALQPWTTYELAKQMRRSVRWFWPRAERRLYDEPKRLAALGLATARSAMTGRRASCVYEVTPAGREALRQWLASPAGTPPQIEVETMIRIFFADAGTPEQLVAAIRSVRDEASGALGSLAGMATESASGRDPFPERRATNALTMELYVRLNETMRDWAGWAEAEVASWPPVRRTRREVAAGPPERGAELFAAIAERAVDAGSRRRPRPGPVSGS